MADGAAYAGSMPESAALLERLIGFDTQSFRSNLELIDFARDRLAEQGVEARLVHDDSGTKANLWAVIGPPDVPGIVLSGHTDVVPVAGQAWSSDPFRARLDGGRIHGRGAADMKGFLACVLALVPELAVARLRKPAILAFSYDEEVGCKGVPRLIDAMLADLPPPEACLIGEPTSMRLVDGHKGKAGYRCIVTGREAHSAYPKLGANAVVAAARIIDHVAEMGQRFADLGPFFPGFDPPHHTSGVGRIEGGSQLNIIPRRCSFEFEFRTLPGEDPMRLVREVEAAAAANRAARPAGDRTRGRDRLRGGPGLSRPGAGAGHTFRPAVPRAHRHPGAGQGVVRDRGRLLLRPRRAGGGLRPGRHRRRAQARRVGGAGATGAMRRLPASARGYGSSIAADGSGQLAVLVEGVQHLLQALPGAIHGRNRRWR